MAVPDKALRVGANERVRGGGREGRGRRGRVTAAASGNGAASDVAGGAAPPPITKSLYNERTSTEIM